jgi:adenylate cyclase class IV
MKEFKIKYDHNKARMILKEIEAEFVKEEVLEDFYLIDDGRDIYKFARVDGKIKIVHLVNEDDGFNVSFIVDIDASAQQEVDQFFDNSKQVMRKEREHYKWQGSEVVLDNIVGLGEFIEFYPARDEEKQELFKVFGVQKSDLITESYYSLRDR